MNGQCCFLKGEATARPACEWKGGCKTQREPVYCGFSNTRHCKTCCVSPCQDPYSDKLTAESLGDPAFLLHRPPKQPQPDEEMEQRSIRRWSKRGPLSPTSESHIWARPSLITAHLPLFHTSWLARRRLLVCADEFGRRRREGVVASPAKAPPLPKYLMGQASWPLLPNAQRFCR